MENSLFLKSRKYNGQITVFLSLSLTIVISLILAVISSAKDRSMRMRSEMAMDMGMQSVFAEYNRELLRGYDLYFIDCAYGGNGGDPYYTGEHLKEYVSYNLNPSKGVVFSGTRNLFALDVDQAQVNLFSLATDANAQVYKRQAIHAIKDQYGLSIIESLKKNSGEYEASGIEDYDVAKEREENARKLEKAKHRTDAEGNPLPYDNPADRVEGQRSGMLAFLLGQMEVSEECVDLSQLASYRDLKSGDGIVENKENLNSLTNELLFLSYLTEKFGSYTNRLHDQGMRYELEYILKGNGSDAENLRQTAMELLLMRETANVIFLMTHKEMQAEPELVATAIALFLECPDLAKPIMYSILFAWGFAEACVDVRTLLKGKRVPIMKTRESWVLTSMWQAVNLKAHLDDGLAKGGFGIDYTGYLCLFLMKVSSNRRVFRSMDMIEDKLRHTAGNSGFCMDKCIEFLEAEIKVISRFGYDYKVCRYFGYEAMPQME